MRGQWARGIVESKRFDASLITLHTKHFGNFCLRIDISSVAGQVFGSKEGLDSLNLAQEGKPGSSQ